MDIRTDVTLPYPRERVFTTYRDRLADLLAYLPNIRKLDIKKREERAGEAPRLLVELSLERVERGTLRRQRMVSGVGRHRGSERVQRVVSAL